MKDGVIILNSARGTLIDEDALITALDSGKVASTWLDVFPEEPYKGRLTGYEQVLLTPHISTYTIQCRMDMEMAAVKNLLRDLGIDL
jgi:D-3-phosphoglycerate dehydrogenase